MEQQKIAAIISDLQKMNAQAFEWAQKSLDNAEIMQDRIDELEDLPLDTETREQKRQERAATRKRRSTATSK